MAPASLLREARVVLREVGGNYAIEFVGVKSGPDSQIGVSHVTASAQEMFEGANSMGHEGYEEATSTIGEVWKGVKSTMSH
jgi:hypothetical protein